ncbi:MAG TPA: oligosaccharide flippase family protein [Gemmataceae bacterium]|nr:oligosaccharide flippase family protein [Gemmataceae bacterium]
MTQPIQSMTNRTLSGLFWMSLATGANVVSLLLVLFVLARLLTPADFGLAAAALMVIGFSAIFAELGIGPAVVQRQELHTTHMRSAFTVVFGMGILFYGLSWLAAPVIAGLFGLDELTPILRVLSLVFPVQGLGIVAESLLQRELRFRCVAGLDTVAVVLGYGGVGISLALCGGAAWALIGAHLAQTCLRTILLLVVRPHPVWPLLDRRACRDLLGFGGGFTAGRFCNYLAGQGEHLVLGYCLGPVALGVYGRAYQLMAGPAVLFGNVLDRVLFPAMVHVQDQPQRLADAYRRGSALIALVILPVSAILVALAPEVIQVFLGSEWSAVIVPLQILGVGMLFRTSCKISDSLVRATGAVHRRTWRQTAYAAMVLIGAWIGQRYGVDGVALAVLGTLALNYFLMAHLSLRLAGMSWRTFAATHVPGLAVAASVGMPVAVAAATLRAWGFAPQVVLFVSLLAMLPSFIVAICMPRIFLGQDGLWMARKVFALIFRAGQAPAPKENRLIHGIQTAGSWEHHPLMRLIRRLASERVRYCRWKSHVDLPRLLSGAGDLDLLVDRHDANTFLRIAKELGFQRVVPCFEPGQVQEIHLYGLDPQTGALLHLHVNLSVDPRFPRLDEIILENCSPGDNSGLLEEMPVVQPQAELIVFIFRTLGQYASWREIPGLEAKREKLEARLHALLAADAEGGWRILLERWLPEVSPRLFAECIETLQQPTSWVRRYLVAARLNKQTRKQETVSPSPCLRLSLSPCLRLWWRLMHGRGNPKQLPAGGAVIAIIGPDASGKSTMVAETSRWLGNVFRIHVAHLGKPPSTWLTWLPNLGRRLVSRLFPRVRASHQSAANDRTGSAGRGLLYHLRAVLLAWDRRTLAVRLARKATQGWIVVCDRYPSAVVGAPDSARLRAPEEEEGHSGLHALLARLEQQCYRAIPRPGVVLWLSAPVGLAISRNQHRQKRDKEGDDFVTRRHKDFFVPDFGGTPILCVDTSTSQAESVQALRRQVWQWLCGPMPQNGLWAEESFVDKGQAPFAADGLKDERAELQKR